VYPESAGFETSKRASNKLIKVETNANIRAD
jgi:hypothetical protein